MRENKKNTSNTAHPQGCRLPICTADPYLVVAEEHRIKSSAINEHLEETVPEPPIFPANLFHKAFCEGEVASSAMNAIVK